MKCKRIMPLALALAIASTTAAEAARLPQNRFSFAVRPSYADGQPSFCEQALTEHRCEQQLHRAGGLSGKRRACQAGTVRADRQHRGAAGGADPRRRTANQLFAHRPSGASCFTALTEAGVSYARAGENIAYGQSTPEAVVQSWMSSSGHRANILSSSFTTIGIGCTVVNGTAYWAQLSPHKRKNRPHLRSVLLYPTVYHEADTPRR